VLVLFYPRGAGGQEPGYGALLEAETAAQLPPADALQAAGDDTFSTAIQPPYSLLNISQLPRAESSARGLGLTSRLELLELRAATQPPPAVKIAAHRFLFLV
jgi:hypothetical protein